jgi:hypothetical protein
MSGARIHEDRDRIVAAADELVRGSRSYEQSLRDYFADVLAAHGGDPSAIWSLRQRASRLRAAEELGAAR